ncbi:hypothetical protein M0657_003230 [Pyricularia oryzae]|uniref:DASH complex subunit DAD3 n=2 Tax=Pyricularia oryzae TaxID=318829 RepID=A0AA97NUE1_PYRO3|nr:hypothetical protein OOU_Y34scaffold00663g2 [Pyricularia oryzae Y34]KAI7920351.1 hypothetical protein M9X92_005957 [Pyricularia oryzae]KAI7927408.1 hypothetical protein M0657_003230 [Pyricularia oryzae]
MFTPRTDRPVHVDRDDCSSSQLPPQSQHHDNFNRITKQVDTNMDQQNTNPLLPPSEVSPLEQEILDEYERLAENMKTLASTLDHLASAPPIEILDGLRDLERKTSLVFTLLKASVYSIVLQQEMEWGDQGGAGGAAGEYDDDESSDGGR